MKLAALIVAGGRSTRMGEDKALIDIGGRPVLGWIIDRLTPQVEVLAINDNTGRFESFGLEIVPDAQSASGTPMAGLCAGLAWARMKGADALLTVPSDSPFLPRDLVARLAAAEAAAVGASGGWRHHLTGLWPLATCSVADAGHCRRVQDWARTAGAATVDWPVTPYDPFFNLNTPEDLAEARRIAAEYHP